MNLPPELRERLSKELRFVAGKMRAENDPFRKLYFFSAAYGEVGRILNTHWDKELSLIHLTLQTTWSSSNQRLAAVTAGEEKGIGLPNNFYNKLASLTEDLGVAIESFSDQKLLEILAGFAELAYMTTGNGFYLYEKGLLKI